MENKIKAIILTDTHLNYKNIDENISIYKQAIDLAKKHGVKNILHGGDIFDARKGQTDYLLKVFEDILDLFKDNDITLVAIPGNHDKTDYKSHISYLDPFKYHPNFNLLRFGGLVDNIYLFPFFDENIYQELFDKEIKKLNINFDNTILLTHISINGVKNNDGTKVENGIKRETFSKFKKVLVGHYHDKSSIIPNIEYIGAAFQHNFGEDNKKGFTLINENNDIIFEKSNFKEFKKVIIDIDKTDLSGINDIVKEFSNSSDNVRLIFKGNNEKLQSIDKQKFIDLGIDVKRESNELIIGLDLAKSNEFISFNKESIKSEFMSFCKDNNLNTKKGVEYLKKVI